MKLDKFISGVEILKRYYDKPDGYHIGAEHDVIYLFATQKPLTVEDVKAMYDLGWGQPDINNESDDPALYDPEQGWSAYV